MGFDSMAGSVGTAALAHAVGLVGDLSVPLGIVFGVGVLGLLLASVRRFLP